MAEESKAVKQIKATFTNDTDLPVQFVNVVNVLGGVEEFYVTVGQAVPPEVRDIDELDNLDNITARPLFRFVVPSSLSERTKVWGRALIVSPILATRWGAGRLRMPTTRPRWEKKRWFAFSPTGC